MKKNRTVVINELIQKYGFKKYLEIGLGNMANYKAIKCDYKEGVDPNYEPNPLTSDDFFAKTKERFDIIFIDGDHTAEQVEKDIFNSWYRLAVGGVMLLHDIYPLTKESTNVPKTSSPWKGDCYKAFVGFIQAYPKINTYTTLDDTGLGFIWKSRNKVELGFTADISWEDFDANRKELLKIK